MRGWGKNIRKVIPYTPGEQPKRKDIIKLNTNENPYPPSPKAVEAIYKMDMDLLRRYPDPKASVLVDAIAEEYQVKPEQVFVGVGSDDVLAIAFLTCFNSDFPILFPDITYSFYDVWAELYQIPYEVQPLDENFLIRPEDYKKENGGIIFPNPNAPTGILMPLEEIDGILAANPGVILIVDEAYIDFGGKSALPLLEKYDNLLIAQTFSKSRSMAGMRIGYLLGNKELISYIHDVKYSFNSYTMNQTSLVAGAEAVKDREYFISCRDKIVQTREWSKQEFKKLGFTFFDSASNFLFVTHEKYSAVQIFEALKEEGIYVRHFKSPKRIANYLRVSIGTEEEMLALFQFLQQYIKK